MHRYVPHTDLFLRDFVQLHDERLFHWRVLGTAIESTT